MSKMHSESLSTSGNEFYPKPSDQQSRKPDGCPRCVVSTVRYNAWPCVSTVLHIYARWLTASFSWYNYNL